jgi:hypothetical protein
MKRLFTGLVFMGAALAVSPQLPAQEAEGPQNVVITFQQELRPTTPSNIRMKHFLSPDAIEKACIAVSLGTQLVMSGGADVTLFPATAGVWLANETLMIESGAADELCFTPMPQDPKHYTPLLDHVRNFVAAGGDIVVCPLCWITRYGPPDDQGYHPDLVVPLDDNGGTISIATGVVDLFLDAEKSIDF